MNTIAHVKKVWRKQRGASLVEFAIILPVLILLASGIWEFGRVYNAFLVATNAAREGARWAALGYNNDSIQDRVLEYVDSGDAGRIGTGELTFDSNTVEVQLLTDAGNGYPTAGMPGAPIKVIVPVTVALYMPGIIGLSDSLTIHGEATMRLETIAGGGAAVPSTPMPTNSPTATVKVPPGKATDTPTPTPTPPGGPTATPTATRTPPPGKGKGV